MSEWQPIDTAPRDGSFFLMHRPGMEPDVVNWPPDYSLGKWHWLDETDDNDRYSSGWRGHIADYDGTHWMPLPPPPEAMERKDG
jgi:hypothetical protein